MSPKRWIALAVGVLALAAGLALSGGIYSMVHTEGRSVYRLNRWTGSVRACLLLGLREIRCVDDAEP